MSEDAEDPTDDWMSWPDRDDGEVSGPRTPRSAPAAAVVDRAAEPELVRALLSDVAALRTLLAELRDEQDTQTATLDAVVQELSQLRRALAELRAEVSDTRGGRALAESVERLTAALERVPGANGGREDDGDPSDSDSAGAKRSRRKSSG